MVDDVAARMMKFIFKSSNVPKIINLKVRGNIELCSDYTSFLSLNFFFPYQLSSNSYFSQVFRTSTKVPRVFQL